MTLTFRQINKTLISIRPNEQWNRKHLATRPESKQQLFEDAAKSTVSICTSSFRFLRMPSGDVPGSSSDAAGWYLLIKIPRSGTEMPEETRETFGKRVFSRLAQTLKWCRWGRNIWRTRLLPRKSQHLVVKRYGIEKVDAVASARWVLPQPPSESRLYSCTTTGWSTCPWCHHQNITICHFHLIEPLISRTLNKHTIQHIGSHCWARQNLNEDQGRRGQVTRREPLNRGPASGQKREMAYIKASIMDVWLLTEAEQMLAANEQSLSTSPRWKPFSD